MSGSPTREGFVGCGEEKGLDFMLLSKGSQWRTLEE